MRHKTAYAIGPSLSPFAILREFHIVAPHSLTFSSLVSSAHKVVRSGDKEEFPQCKSTERRPYDIIAIFVTLKLVNKGSESRFFGSAGEKSVLFPEGNPREGNPLFAPKDLKNSYERPEFTILALRMKFFITSEKNWSSGSRKVGSGLESNPFFHQQGWKSLLIIHGSNARVKPSFQLGLTRAIRSVHEVKQQTQAKQRNLAVLSHSRFFSLFLPSPSAREKNLKK